MHPLGGPPFLAALQQQSLARWRPDWQTWAIVAAIALPVLWIIGRSLRQVPAKLAVLMFTAFVDMVGLLIVLPLLPFYATRMGAGGFVVGALMAAFSVAQLLSAPLWGRFSDKFGRRPALMVALTASAMAYVIFAFATSIPVLFLSRIVQGAGGGTVGVIQAYVADAVEPKERARGLGWLSAATNLGVFLGPALGGVAVGMSRGSVTLGGREIALGHASPGLLAAALCLANLAFVWRFLGETRVVSEHPRRPGASRTAVVRVLTHSADPAARLIWIYAIAIGAQQGTTGFLALLLARRFGVTEHSIAYFFMYIGAISVLARAVILGKALDLFGEAKLSRIGSTLLALGLATIPLASSIPTLALAVALMPLGAAFTFPGVTALLSRVIPTGERGLYMGVQQTFGGTSRVIFPLLAGQLYDRFGPGVPFWVASSCVAGTILLGLGMEHYERR